MVVERKKKSFDNIKDEYDHLFATVGIRDDKRAYHWHAKQIFHTRPNLQHLLDVACGAGYFLSELAEIFQKTSPDLTGYDISETALDLARKECPAAQYALGVAEEMPFDDGTFDAITCLGSLEHFLDTNKAIAEMKRVASSDAIFYVLVPNMFWYKDLLAVLFKGQRKTRNQSNERFESMGDWKEVLEDAGLDVVSIKKYNGIARSRIKQWFKDLLIPTRFSYHCLYICRKKNG